MIMKAGTPKTSTNRAVHAHLTSKSSQRREGREYFRNKNKNGSAEEMFDKIRQLQALGLTRQGLTDPSCAHEKAEKWPWLNAEELMLTIQLPPVLIVEITN